ncbi:hypothetical protein [Streptomyces sp. NPDC058155]|uniref:hypothetical protein n=1 Tax=Streptomyces sp. NPDC058155 TaxID=3346359 RepID=UPI0036E0EEA5
MSGRLSRLREDLRQRRHHRAFRIAPLPWDEPSREELERLLASVAASVVAVDTAAGKGTDSAADSTDSADSADSAGEPGADDGRQLPGAEDPLDAKALADAATNLWRAQRRLTRQGEAASSRSRQTGRYLRSCREALDDAGLLVQEHEGDAFHTGRSLEALTFQEDPSLTAETVLETIRPTIYLHGRRIQMGQVIVGCPPASASVPAPEPEPALEPVPALESDPAPVPVPVPVPGPVPAPEPEDAVPAPASARETPSSSDHERTDHA